MKKLLILAVVLLVGLSACDKNKDYVVIIHTEFGDMKVILYDETPLHKRNFLELAKEGKYDSTVWHRVIKGFMIQGGDVNAKEGTRETENDRIDAEIVEGFYHTKGALAAARQGDNVNPEKKSSAVQFYIVHGKQFTKEELTTDQAKLSNGMSTIFNMPEYDTLVQEYIKLQRAKDFEALNNFIYKYKPLVEKVTGQNMDVAIDPKRLEAYTSLGGAPHLDTEYTVFGRVVEGLDVIDKIAAIETARMDKPVKNSYITMEVVMMAKKDITKLYGYEYPEKEKK
jgi:peptidyl-prolyl cis-trans isomerase B (cyclophilin B)